MKKATAFKRYVLVAAVSVVAMLATSVAQADTVICADPVVSGQDRQYQTTGASDCVWGDGNIGNDGNGTNDDFLSGGGTNDALYGNSGPAYAQFGLSWSLIDSENASSQGIPVSLTGLTISRVADTLFSDTFAWTLDILPNTSYKTYALGLKDGGDPKWAVFLLTETSGIAKILQVEGLNSQGNWSHVALYGSTGTPPCTGPGCGPPPAEIPEPGTLALVGLALLGGAALRRRRS